MPTPAEPSRIGPRDAGLAGGETHPVVGIDAGLSHVEVEDDGGGDDGHYDAGGGAEADLAILEKLLDSSRGAEPERASSCQEDGVDAHHHVRRVQHLRLAHPRGRPSDVHPGDRTLLHQHHRASGLPRFALRMPHFDSRNVGQ
jgi:hypothetical protein